MTENIHGLCKEVTDRKYEMVKNKSDKFKKHRHTSFYCTRQVLHSYKLKFCGNPALNKSISAIFQQYLFTSCPCVTSWYAHNI